jgi:ATP-dependent helicase/nuclease subunit A
MRERIAHAIAKELEVNSPKEAYIRRQLTLLGKASIMTLHAFCTEVVKKHFHFIDVDPAFRIGDTTETTILQMEALEEQFEEAYKKADPLFLELVEAYGGSREDLPLQNLILSIYSFIQSQPYPIRWLEEKTAAFKMPFEDFENSVWMKAIRETVSIHLKEALQLLAEAKELCGRPYGPAAYLNAIDNDISMLKELLISLGSGTKYFYERIKELKHLKLMPAGKDCDEVYKQEAKALRDQAKELVKKLNEDYFALSPEDNYKDIKYLHPLMAELSKLVAAFGERYREKKLEKGIVDFNDLEHYALGILEHPQVAAEYKERFQYIFIDEYQENR